MRLIRFPVIVCLLCLVSAAPTDRREIQGYKVYDDSLFYSLFLRLMSNGDLKSWIHIIKPYDREGDISFGSQSISQTNNGQQNSQSTVTTHNPGDNQPSTLEAAKITSNPLLTIERDDDPNFFIKTTSPSVNDLTVERDHVVDTTPIPIVKTTRSAEKGTIPVILLTGPGSDKIVVPSTSTENLTVIRDYPSEGQKTTQVPPVRNKRSFVIPVITLNSAAKYNQPGDIPPQSGLAEDAEDLVVVRDSVDSQTANGVATGDSAPPRYVNNPDTDSSTTSAPMRRLVIVDVCGNRLCFKIRYEK